MPISNSYPRGIPVEDQDLFVGTKAYNNRTVNYTAQGVADYLNINSKVSIGGQMSFQFVIVPNVAKTIAFDGGGGDNTAFSAITKLIVSAIDVSTANITIFLNYLNNSQVLLSEQNQPNFFGHYKIIGYAQIGTSAFYELDLEFIGGNGTIIDKQYYDLVSFVLSTEVPIPTLQQVVTQGNSISDNTIDFYELGNNIGSIGGGYTFLFFNNQDSGGYKYFLDAFGGFSISTQDDTQYSILDTNALSFYETSKNAYFNVNGFFKGDLVNFKSLSINFPATIVGTNKTQTFQDASGTIALLSDIPTTSGFVPYTGATTDLNLGTYNLTADHINLNVSPSGAGFVVGSTQWSNDLGSSQTLLKGGSVILKNGVDLVARVVNKVTPNTTLTKAAYQVVRVSGAQGQRLAIDLARANNDLNSADTLGVVTETITTNQEGFILTVGQLLDINTTGSLQGETWADGDVLYLSPTIAGRMTNIKPNGSNGHIVVLGYVEYAHANNGKIYVKIMNGWELDELHNVFIDNPLNNQVLSYNSAVQLWENKDLDQIVSERRNANNSSNSNINYCGTAPNGSAESATVWTIIRLTIAASGSVTTATATNVAWTNRESAIYI
jgi:hypothetical protein